MQPPPSVLTLEVRAVTLPAIMSSIPMMKKITFQTFTILLLLSALLAPVSAQRGGHFNIIVRSTAIANGHGEIRVDGGGQEASQLEISMSDGPLTVTKVLVPFAGSKLSPGRPTLHREKMLDWTSPPDQMAERQGLASIYSVYN